MAVYSYGQVDSSSVGSHAAKQVLLDVHHHQVRADLIQLWPYVVMAICSYGPIWLRPVLLDVHHPQVRAGPI